MVVFCLVGLLPTFVIETIVIFLQWYEIACRSKEFTEETLNLMDEYMKRYVYKLDNLYRSRWILIIYIFWNLKIVKFKRWINWFSNSCFTGRYIHLKQICIGGKSLVSRLSRFTIWYIIQPQFVALALLWSIALICMNIYT